LALSVLALLLVLVGVLLQGSSPWLLLLPVPVLVWTLLDLRR